MQIEGCRAIVTGGNRGIGEGFVRELLSEGAAKVYIGARTPSEAEDLASVDPERLEIVKLDVSKPEEIDAAAKTCGDVNLLVNNAGAFSMETLLGAPDTSALRTEIETNYIGLVSMCRAFAPIIEANGGGAIANVLSAGGIVAVPSMGGYSPSKFAARAASDCMRAELAPRGVHVTALIVGSVKTRMAAHVRGVKQSDPADIAKSGIHAIKNEINEHDTDPHAISVRAALARDPAGLAAAMAARLSAEN
ncbi:SDR family oxidoreductase [Hyphococcus luteus]|uniref:Short-chain dehydrogenase n=1 Tax=Hyphococcus luteus TaxID=2058213 RepID=A0A2S7K0K1_9PROT|nr:SDR family oxidoreductase [Marinicaulis flavus]PQA85991.1 short-chain dehydrogenase [Marinicaulis flavus]